MGKKSHKRSRETMEHKHGKDRAFRVHKALRAPLEQMGIRRIPFQKAVKRQNGFNTSVGINVEDERGDKGFALPPAKGSLFNPKLVLRIADWSAPRPVGPGLRNLGNTCFLNSVLQCLAYTAPLAQFMQHGELSRSLRSSGAFGMAKAIEKHIATCSSGKVGGPISPVTIVRNIHAIGRQFRPGRQEDAHEFTRCLIDVLQRTALRAAGVKESSPMATTTFVHRIFGGFLRSQIRCKRCKNESNTFDPFLDVPLELSGGTTTLDKAFQHFTRTEHLTGDNGWKCDRCKRQVDAKKRLQLRSLPNVMTVLLKRFRFGGLLGGKIDVAVEYPKVFDAGPYTCGDAAPLPRAATRYRLYGVLVHAGSSMQFGHYYCFIKAANGVWYEMNDASVRQVSEQTALRQRAYMLFYARDKAGVAAALAAEHPELLSKAKEKVKEKEPDAAGGGADAKSGVAAVEPAAPVVPFVPVSPSSAAATPVSQWGSLKGPGASTTEGEEAERALELGRAFADAPTPGAVASGAFDEVSALAEAARELQAVESAHGERRRAFLDELHQRGLPKKQRKALAREEAPTNARELAGVAAFAARWADAHAPAKTSASKAAAPGSGDSESGSGDESDADAEQSTVQSHALARDLQPIVARPDSSDDEDEEQETAGPSPPLRDGPGPVTAEEGGAPPSRQRVGLAVKLMQRATLFLRRRHKQPLVVDSKAPASGDGGDAKSSGEDGSDGSEDRAEVEAQEEKAKASSGSTSSEDEAEAEAQEEKTEAAPGAHERKRRRLVTSSLDVRAVSWRSTLPGASAKTKAWDAEDVVGGADQLKQREALLSRQIRAERTQAKARKLDKWDSALDKGRQRKVKGEVARRNREVHSSAPGSNAFHRAQERFRRAGRPMGKGKKRNRPPPSARL